MLVRKTTTTLRMSRVSWSEKVNPERKDRRGRVEEDPSSEEGDEETKLPLMVVFMVDGFC